MLLVRAPRDRHLMVSASRQDLSSCFGSRWYVANSLGFYLFFVLCILRCRANGQQSAADVEATISSPLCAQPTIAELMLSGKGGREGFCQNILEAGDRELLYRDMLATAQVVELNETMLEQALALPRSNGTFTMVLFYANWCPFSRELRPTYDVLSSLFPSINHIAVEGTNLRPSVLSKYGVHSYPLLFLYDKASREKYQGSRRLKDLIMFMKNATGVNPITQEKSIERQLGSFSKVLTETGGDTDFVPLTQSFSASKWLQNDTYLMLATWFLVLRILLPLLPWISSKLKRFWNRCHVHFFARFKISSFFKEKPTRRTFAVELTELKSRHFTQRWSKSLLS